MTQREQELLDALVEEFRASLTKKFTNTKATFLNIKGADDTFELYAKTIADYYCIDVDVILNKVTRISMVKTAKQTLWWLCRTGESALPYSFAKLGEICGGMHHATVLHGVRRLSDDVNFDSQIRRDTTEICKLLGFTIEKVGMNYTTKNVLETVAA